MAINNSNLSSVVTALRNDNTTESSFKTAIENVATQVDASQVDLDSIRNIALTGDVEGNVDFTLYSDPSLNADQTTYSTGTPGNLSISISTDIKGSSILNADIAPGVLEDNRIKPIDSSYTGIARNKIANDAIDNAKLANDSINYEQFNNGGAIDGSQVLLSGDTGGLNWHTPVSTATNSAIVRRDANANIAVNDVTLNSISKGSDTVSFEELHSLASLSLTEAEGVNFSYVATLESDSQQQHDDATADRAAIRSEFATADTSIRTDGAARTLTITPVSGSSFTIKGFA